MQKMLIGLRDWVDERLPVTKAWNTHMGQYYAPKNFNFWYFFGVLSLQYFLDSNDETCNGPRSVQDLLAKAFFFDALAVVLVDLVFVQEEKQLPQE